MDPIEIQPNNDDDENYIGIVENILNNLIDKYNVDEINLIKIKNWFDHKWLNNTGKGVIHFEGTTNPDKVALQNYWKDKITVPPFNPNRVIKEINFYKTKIKNKTSNNPLHKWQLSTDNQNNRIETKSENGLFFWYSSNTIKNDQGSIMVYYVYKSNVESWYASFEKKDKWVLNKTKGIDKKILTKYFV